MIEIYTDASIRQFGNGGRVFGCAGALCATTGESKYVIVPDTTNNRSELLAIYLGLELAEEIRRKDPSICDEIYLYSDSQFGVFGLTRWIFSWLKTMDSNGVMYGSNKQPVKNQELFAMILSYISCNKIHIKFRHMAGHVRYTSQKMLMNANETFYRSNGYYLRPEDIYKICYYNDIVDRTSRAQLDSVNPNDYPVNMKLQTEMVSYTIPKNFKHYIS